MGNSTDSIYHNLLSQNDDMNEDSDSKTFNDCFCLGIKIHTHANTHIPTHILTKYFRQRDILPPES